MYQYIHYEGSLSTSVREQGGEGYGNNQYPVTTELAWEPGVLRFRYMSRFSIATTARYAPPSPGSPVSRDKAASLLGCPLKFMVSAYLTSVKGKASCRCWRTEIDCQ